MSVKKLLVTGATGFLGTNLLLRVKEKPDFVVLGTFHHTQPTIHASNISYTQADLQNADDCRRIVQGMDYVCMFAGRPSTTAIMVKQPLGPVTENIIINTQMLQAAHAAGVQKYLWISSSAAYPPSDRPLREDDFFVADPSPPHEAYGWNVRYLEKLSQLYATKPTAPMTVIAPRPAAIFGLYDDFNYATCRALPALIRRVVERQAPIEIWGSGDDQRDWLYAGDLIDACLLALASIEGFAAFNLGKGITHSLNQLLSYILEIDDYQDAKIIHRLEKSHHISTRSLDCSCAEKLLGYKAQTSIQQALTKTIHWYRLNRLH